MSDQKKPKKEYSVDSNGGSSTDTSRGVSWGHLMYEFTQNTTLHGVRYITADTPYILRRIVWGLLCSGSFIFFVWFMTDRLMYMQSYPKAVDVEVIYTDTVPFPAVTICNQNLFRSSETHKLGLYDVVEESFKKILGTYTPDGFEIYPNKFLKGMGPPHATFVDITAQVCKRLCEQKYSDSCCSVIYERASRKCYITPLDVNSTGVSLVDRLYTDYYKRKKCQVQSEAHCDFDNITKGFCNFVQDFTKSLSWELVTANNELDVRHPPRDHTLNTGLGRYILAMTKFQAPNSVAHLISPYILSGEKRKGTCMKFYYWITGGVLSIKTKEQGNKITTIWNREAGGPYSGWQKALIKLPQGYFRIIIESMDKEGTGFMNVAVDDIDIEQCKSERGCLESSTGVGYTGQKARTSSGKLCLPWKTVKPYIWQTVWRYQNVNLTAKNIRSYRRNCLNPDEDILGPWCFVGDINASTMEYCDIPKCGCRDVDFSCNNGRCISTDLVCDSNDDCGDFTDELDVCNRTESVECNFSDGWMCGYKSTEDSALDWHIQGEGTAAHLTMVALDNLSPGDIGQITTPEIQLTDTRCLHINYELTGNVHLDIYKYSDPLAKHKERVCSLPSTSNYGYNASDLLLESGSYHLLFEVIFLDKNDVRVRFDNLTLLNENCTIDIIEELPLEVTTAFYDFYNLTSDNITYDNSTELLTTAMYEPEVTTEPPWEFLHPPFTHPRCIDTLSTKCHTCERDLTDLKCESEFIRAMDITMKVSSGCKRISTTSWLTRKECFEEAIGMQGNVINFRQDQCDILLCDDINELMYTGENGAWEVYALQTSEELDGVECRFTAPCGCGYTMSSNNLYNIWERVSVDKYIQVSVDVGNDTEANTTNVQLVKEWYVRMNNTKGIDPKLGDWVRLITPMQLHSKDVCLKFKYFTRYVDIRVYRQTNKKIEDIMQISHDGQDSAWHTASATVKAGYFSLVFEAFIKSSSTTWAGEHVGLDSIIMENGACAAEVLEGPISCSFDEEDYCGYRDFSDGIIKWVRSKNFDDKPDTPGPYYARTSGLLPEKGTVLMKSPFYTYHNLTCIDFWIFVQGGDKQAPNTLSLLLEYSNGNQELIWLVRGVTDNIWHYANVEIWKDEPFRLVFQLTGTGIRAGVDHVMLNTGACPQHNCSTAEFQCASSVVCIEQTNKCDDVANCELAEDEEISMCTDNKTINQDLEKPETPTTEAVLDPVNTPNVKDIDLSLTEIYMRAGHQAEDFIYRCKFEGKPCNENQFYKNVTDYGLCYTFNSEHSKPLLTKKTGSRFGLSLTLNIEQYEYMLGPQSDAGIKVFLHAKTELPEVRDLGFAVPPGSHALVGVRLNQAKNLIPPWGECSSRELKYFDRYTYSLCLRECETLDVVDHCRCRDAYMPGISNNDPPICNLSMYFSCAIPSINGLTEGKDHRVCDCPKPCNQTIYEPTLSSAALSVLSVDNILSDSRATVEKKYQTALEAKQRTQEESFVKHVELIDEIVKLYINLRKLGKNYLGDSDKSTLDKIWTASDTLVNKVFLTDIERLLSDIPKYRAYYTNYYKGTVELVIQYLHDLSGSFQELDNAVMAMLKGYETSRFFDDLVRNTLMDVTLARDNLIVLEQKISNTSFITTEQKISDNEASFRPTKFFLNEASCSKRMLDLIRQMGNIVMSLEEIQAPQMGNETHNETQLKVSHNSTLQFFNSFPKLLKCLEEYPKALDKVERWKEKMQELAESYTTGTPFNGVSYNYTQEAETLKDDENSLQELLHQYAYGKISKLNYLKRFSKDSQSAQVLNNLNLFVNKITKKLTEPLKKRLSDIKNDLQFNYRESLVKAASFERYLGEASFYNRAKVMKIWNVPFPQLENPEVFEDTGREYWRIWNKETPIAKFAEESASVYITEGLNSFCNPLIDQYLEQFEAQLHDTSLKIGSKTEVINQEYEAYLNQMKVNHNFVLNNFLNMDVYFAQLKHQQVIQQEAYQLTQFLGDVGGFMGLLLGASVLTLCELFDLVIFNFIKKLGAKDKVTDPELGGSRDLCEKDRDDSEKPLDRGSLDDMKFYKNPYSTDYGITKDKYNGLV